MLSPRQIQEKADILETNLFKSISKQADPSKIQVKIHRTHFPDTVILKALLRLTPRFNIDAQDFLPQLRELLKKEIPQDEQEKFENNLNDAGENLHEDFNIFTRTFEAIVSEKELTLIFKGVPEIKSRNGEIAKSFFNHEQSPGKILKDGLINFKEINKFPIVIAKDKLFYITHEKQGKHGVSFDGKILLADEAEPFIINIGPGVTKTEVPDETGESKGYFLTARTSGVVILDRDENNLVTGIDISEKIEVKKLDYSTGNIGSHHTCPIRMKIGVICNGFKIRVNGKVESAIVDGGYITTNDEAVIERTQSGSRVTALKDISIDSVTQSKIMSECGTITLNRELIDSQISSPKVVFEKNKALITNNRVETNNLILKGLYFSGENIIYFGSKLFAEQKELISALEKIKTDRLEYSNTEKRLMGQLQVELKRMTKLAIADHDLVQHIKPLILATQTMDFEIIHPKMEMIQKRNNTKVVFNVKKLFQTLEELPKSIEACDRKESELNKEMTGVNQRMTFMTLSIEGFLRPAASIKIFCGTLEDKKIIQPDFIFESDTLTNKVIKIVGTYSSQKGFEFIQ